MVGETLDRYTIESKLGEGGMGVVYRARDTHLDRFVAIKVLPPDKVADADRKQRFVQEAKAASALNHPGIVTIYDIRSQAGIDFIVMEYAPGRTLDHVIPPKGLGIGQALRFGVQIADALSTAHEAGIIHRDLKPSNVMVTEDNRIKILDFGLAKLLDRTDAAADARTRSVPMTEAGVVVGTAAYMSPEQAEGRKVEARSDIFSFGSVLYEMVTGRRPFVGDSSLSVLAKVLNDDPTPPSQIAASVPPDVERAILRCLRKDPARRYQTMADLKVALEDFASDSDAGQSARTSTLARATRPWRWAWAALIPVLLGVAYVTWQATRTPNSPTPLRALPLTSLHGTVRNPSFAPDGERVAFAWSGPRQDNPDIYVQQIGAGSPLRLTTDPGDDYSPVWSPDGRSIAFLRRQADSRLSELRLVPPLGGPERTLTEIRPHGAFLRTVTLGWCPDSTCVVVTDARDETSSVDALFVVSVDTGTKRQLTHPRDLTLADTDPAMSPDGRWLAFRRDTAPFNGQLQLLAIDSGVSAKGEPRSLTPTALFAYSPAWLPDSTGIVFSAKGALWRLAIGAGSTAERLPFVGEDGIMPVVSRPQPGGRARLAYLRSFADSNIWRIERASAAAAPPVVAIVSTRRDEQAEFSPDAQRVVFTSDRSGELEIWAADASGGNPIQLASLSASSGAGRWSPDGKTIAFHSNPDGQGDVFVVAADGGKPRNLTNHPATDVFPSFSGDGHWIYFSSTRAGEPAIWKLPVSGGDAVRVSPGSGLRAIESPDRAFLYYAEATSTDRPSPLLQLSLKDGVVVRLPVNVASWGFCVIEGGIYHVERAPGDTRIMYFDLSSHRSTVIARNLGNAGAGLTASPDGRSLLFSRVDSSVNDLMLVEVSVDEPVRVWSPRRLSAVLNFRAVAGDGPERAIQNDKSSAGTRRPRLDLDSRLAVLASAIPVGIFQTNLEGRCLYVNARVSELTGLSVEQALQFGWEQCVHPDDRVAVSRDLRAALLAGEPRQVECRCVLPDGTIRWLLCQSTPEFDAQGRLVGCIGTLVDSTDTRETLRASEERFRLAAESARVGVLDYDVAADRGLWSPELCSILGIPAGGVITLARGFDVCHPDDQARVERAMAAAVDPKGSGAFAEEFRILRADKGETRWVACTCTTHFAGAGDSRQAVRFTGIVTDITERKVREEHDQFVSDLIATWVRARDTPTLVRIVTDALSPHLHVRHAVVSAIPPDPSAEETWTVASDLSEAARAHLAAGRPLVVNDTATDLRAESPRYVASGVRALIAVPVLGDGELRAVLAVATPDVRAWRLDEVQLLEHVATRLWPKMARVRAEEALRRSEERQAFLLTLSDALRPLSDPLDVQETAARLLGEHLHVNRVGYAEIENNRYIIRREYVRGVPPLAGQGPAGTFGASLTETYRRGDPVVVNDVRTDPRFTELERGSLQERQIAAMAGVMLLKGGRLVAAFGANHATPRLWTPTEIALVHDVAERTWAAVERARAEASLREREQRLRLALDASGGGSWTWDVPTNQLDWDQAFRAIYGFTRDEPPASEKWMAGVHEEDRPQVLGLLEQVLHTPTMDAWDNTFRFVRPDGTVLWMQSLGRADRDAAGAVTRLTGLELDITERRRADEALQARRDEERDRELRLLLDTATQGIVSVDAQGTIVMANHALEWMFGWGRGELVGQSLERLLPASSRDVHVRHRTQYFAEARSGPMGVDMDLVGQRQDGSTFPIEVILNHVDTPGGGRALAFVTDVTARRRAAAVIRDRTRELEHRTAQLSRLASDLTLAEQHAREELAKTLHDGLQQILVSAALNVERQVTRDAQQGAAVSEPLLQAKRHLDEAIAAARSLSFELFPPVLHTSGLPDALTWLGERIGHEYGLVVQVFADPLANSERKDVRILLFESVRELLFNAVKHAQVDRATVDLVLRPDDTLCITVSDQGIGFDPAGLVDRTRAGQVGWGLFSIRERLTLLGGRFDIDSAPQRGTQFRLIAPRGSAEAVVVDGQTTSAGVVSHEPARALRILIVDDHAGVREVFREMIEERRELRVVGEAADGLEAIAKAHELRPDVVLMDVSMPVMDGVQATRRLRAELPFIQVLGLSTYARTDAQAIELAGAAGFFSKSADAQRLVDHLMMVHARTAPP